MQWAEQFQGELDAKKRAELRDKILQYDRENVVVLPIVVQDGLWVAGPRVIEYTPRPAFKALTNLYTIKVKP